MTQYIVEPEATLEEALADIQEVKLDLFRNYMRIARNPQEEYTPERREALRRATRSAADVFNLYLAALRDLEGLADVHRVEPDFGTGSVRYAAEWGLMGLYDEIRLRDFKKHRV